MMNKEDNKSKKPFLEIFAEDIPKLCIEEGKTKVTLVDDETTDDD